MYLYALSEPLNSKYTVYTDAHFYEGHAHDKVYHIDSNICAQHECP